MNLKTVRGKYSPSILLTIGLTFALVISFLPCFVLTIPSLAQEVPHDSYAYILGVSVTPNYVFMLDESTIVLIGTLNDSSVVQVVDINDPYSGPHVLQTYPLVGRVTAVATNGFPVERIAVGTDQGDIVLFKVDGGKISALLHDIEGVDFAVKKLVVMKSGDNYKLAVLADEGGAGKGLCVSCQVYVFDENTGNALRIGPVIGNASLFFDKVYPQDITAALKVANGMYYYDASEFVVSWVPYKENFYVIEVNVTYLGAEKELIPGANALVEIVAYNETLNAVFRYGVNANDEGIAEVLVPIGYLANLTLKDISGRSYTIHIDPRTFPPGVMFTYVFLQLLSAPITYPASVFYKTPEFMLATIDILDVSAVPNGYSKTRNLTVKINPHSSGLSLVKGVNSPIYTLFYYDPEAGLSYLKVYDEAFTELSTTTDYVGKGAVAAGAFTFPDGKLVIVGYQDGRIKYYSLGEDGKTYNFFQELVLGGELTKFSAIPIAGTYYYFAYSKSGLQIVKTYPYQIPLLREGIKVSYGRDSSVDGDVLGNLKVAVVASSNNVTVIKGLDKIIEKNRPINLDTILAPTLYVSITVPEGEELNGTTVTLQYPGGEIIKNLTGEDNTVVFYNIIPFRNYTLLVNYPKPYIMPVRLSLYPTSFEDIYKQVTLNYKKYRIKINIQDNISGTLVAPYQVILDGNVVVESTKESQVELEMIFGNHTITVAPAEGFESVYNGVTKEIVATNDTEIDVVLARRKYPLEVMVIDTKSETPIAPLLVSVEGIQEKVISLGKSKAIFEVPYGNYTIVVSPLKGYEQVYETAYAKALVNKPTVITVVLDRKQYLVNISIKDTTVGFLAGEFDVYVNDTKVLSNVKGEANITLEYGVYEIKVKPSPEFESVYKESSPEIVKVTNDTAVEFPVGRKFYTITVYVFDDTGNPIKGAEVAFFSIDKGAYVSTLITDEAGTVYASMFYSEYRLDVSATGYFAKHETVKVDKDVEIKIVLQPEPITLIFRYMPVAVIVIIAGIAVIIVLKVRAKIVERLSQSEELF